MQTIIFIPTLEDQSFSEFYSWNELVSSFPDYDFESIQAAYDHLEDHEAFSCAQVWIVLDLGERNEYYHITDFLRWGTAWTYTLPGDTFSSTGILQIL